MCHRYRGMEFLFLILNKGGNMNIKEMKSIIAKEFGVNSFASPLGTCKEYFLNDKILQVAVKNNFPPTIIDKFKNNPYRFGQC